MQDVSILLEHVDLLDAGDGLDVHLLQGGLQLPVISGSGGSGLFDLLSSGSSLSTWMFHVISCPARIEERKRERERNQSRSRMSL